MTIEMTFYYTTQLEWKGGKVGELSGEGIPRLTVVTPPEFHGPSGNWSPEQLFVAAANACVMTTFLAIAEKSRLAIQDYRSTATGRLEKLEAGESRSTDEAGLQITEIVIRPRLTVADERDREKAAKLIAKAEEQCLISKSMKANVVLKPEILAGATPARAVGM